MHINSQGEDKKHRTHFSSCISIEIVLFFFFLFSLLHKTNNVSNIQVPDGFVLLRWPPHKNNNCYYRCSENEKFWTKTKKQKEKKKIVRVNSNICNSNMCSKWGPPLRSAEYKHRALQVKCYKNTILLWEWHALCVLSFFCLFKHQAPSTRNGTASQFPDLQMPRYIFVLTEPVCCYQCETPHLLFVLQMYFILPFNENDLASA